MESDKKIGWFGLTKLILVIVLYCLGYAVWYLNQSMIKECSSANIVFLSLFAFIESILLFFAGRYLKHKNQWPNSFDFTLGFLIVAILLFNLYSGLVACGLF